MLSEQCTLRAQRLACALHRCRAEVSAFASCTTKVSSLNCESHAWRHGPSKEFSRCIALTLAVTFPCVNSKEELNSDTSQR
jgi:hypothetical protein